MNEINLDLCTVVLTKEKENDIFVWYKFKFNVETDQFNYDSRGRKIKIWEPHYGIIKISKNCFSRNIAHDEKQIMEIEKEGTDPVFFMLKQKRIDYIIHFCLLAIYKFKTSEEFPDYAARQI